MPARKRNDFGIAQDLGYLEHFSVMPVDSARNLPASPGFDDVLAAAAPGSCDLEASVRLFLTPGQLISGDCG